MIFCFSFLSPLFGKDDTVSDTFGVDFTPKPRTASNVSASKPTKKVDLMNDEVIHKTFC